MKIIEDFNQNWRFIPEKIGPDTPDDRFESVTLPHTNKLFTARFVDNNDYQFVSTYRKCFMAPDHAAGQRVFIDFDGVMLMSAVDLNGEMLGIHKGGYTPFSFDITEHLVPGENVLTVLVDATEAKDIPPYGNLVDYLTFGGIYRDVHLRLVDPCHIANAFVRPTNVLTSPGLECDVQLSQYGPGLGIEAILKDAQGAAIAQQTQDVTGESLTVVFADLKPISLWSLKNPHLYNLLLVLLRDGEPIDDESVRFGFRTAEFSDDGSFYLNGQPIKLIGLNRHQTYPYIGAAAPRRLQRMDADILKGELGCSIVRTSHYPQSPHFLDRCDEIGLLVFEELAGWQHIGDDAWQTLALQDLQAMIERDRNHPSVVLWGVRINESPDDDALYTKTNALAHQLDPTRQTGGVRNFIQSKCLEDVFTLNDFSEGIRTPKMRPHLITEFCGHMFPTKTWDHEAHRVEHALKHAYKHSQQLGHPDVAGAIGWCAFDYYTHQEFGSGDRICYHGVMDIYRLPKMAAYFYRSQKSPDDEIVLYAATNWTMGDRSGGGNNPLVVFSNCQEIELLIDDTSQGIFKPDAGEYRHLDHPPFIVRWPEPYDPWGTACGALTVKGYIDRAVVAEQHFAQDHRPHSLRLSAYTDCLNADGADITRIAVQVIDQYGNVLPYQVSVVKFTLEGEADFIGENPMSLLGGQGACFVKSRHTPGTVTVTAHTANLQPVSIVLQIVG